jgi:hypothetical protein
MRRSGFAVVQEKQHKKSYQDDVFRIRFFTRFLRSKKLDKVSRDLIDGIITRHLAGPHRRPRIFMSRSFAPFSGRYGGMGVDRGDAGVQTYVGGAKPRVRWLPERRPIASWPNCRRTRRT